MHIYTMSSNIIKVRSVSRTWTACKTARVRHGLREKREFCWQLYFHTRILIERTHPFYACSRLWFLCIHVIARCLAMHSHIYTMLFAFEQTQIDTSGSLRDRRREAWPRHNSAAAVECVGILMNFVVYPLIRIYPAQLWDTSKIQDVKYEYFRSD